MRVALGLLLSVLALTAHAQSTVIDLPRTLATLEVPDGWQPIIAPSLVAAYKHPSGAVLAVTRADVPNPDAWKTETKQAYADTVERGIKAALPGAKRTSKKLGTANGVPALDIESRRENGATVLIRVLLFRTYALSLAIEVPKNGDIAVARTIVAAFTPPKPA